MAFYLGMLQPLSAKGQLIEYYLAHPEQLEYPVASHGLPSDNIVNTAKFQASGDLAALGKRAWTGQDTSNLNNVASNLGREQGDVYRASAAASLATGASGIVGDMASAGQGKPQLKTYGWFNELHEGKALKRGWTPSAIEDVLENGRQISLDVSTNNVTHKPATAYIRSDGHYLVVDVNNVMIQGSDLFDSGWIYPRTWPTPWANQVVGTVP